MTIWRLTINTSAKDGVDPRKFCIENNILGFGWPVSHSKSMDWDTYERLGTETYYNDNDKGWWPAVNAIHNRMEIGDLCWTRDWEGRYYLGRVEGPWEYRADERHTNADIVNVRSCKWIYIGTDDSVPGKVINSFRASRTLQAVHDETAAFYSKLRFNKEGNAPKYDLSPRGKDLDFFSLISTEDCEDIVGIYLQEVRGFRLIPSTCRSNTLKTEFILRKLNQKAQAQVKQGNVIINMADYSFDKNDPCDWYLFTTCGHYVGQNTDYVHCLDPEEMRNFVYSNITLMSDRVRQFVEFCLEENLHY
ncbi:MAG: hypothetical protein F4Z87_06880 [Gammaproteobacteria bacterium]|nr:hypothetical protein [Gammaproteobacteria bacterium]MYE30797.1 hypothetical protein [Gammaproteobacteria bacterium]